MLWLTITINMNSLCSQIKSVTLHIIIYRLHLKMTTIRDRIHRHVMSRSAAKANFNSREIEVRIERTRDR